MCFKLARFVRCTVFVLFLSLLSACNFIPEPIPHEFASIVGVWQAPNAELSISRDGKFEYKFDDGSTKKYQNVMVTDIDEDELSAGLWVFNDEYEIERWPEFVNGRWQMTMDGQLFLRNDEYAYEAVVPVFPSADEVLELLLVNAQPVLDSDYPGVFDSVLKDSLVFNESIREFSIFDLFDEDKLSDVVDVKSQCNVNNTDFQNSQLILSLDCTSFGGASGTEIRVNINGRFKYRNEQWKPVEINISDGMTDFSHDRLSHPQSTSKGAGKTKSI